jgi:hypothetical protein
VNFKNIHIGILINQAVTESGIEMSRICNFFKCKEKEVTEMYQAKSLDTEILLKWSKLLEYDFFRIYTHKKSSLPQFRKNIYTKEIIDFILEQISNGKMTKNEVIERYRIPKTTLYKWISKYSEIK